jgi:hypothetical protein
VLHQLVLVYAAASGVDILLMKPQGLKILDSIAEQHYLSRMMDQLKKFDVMVVPARDPGPTAV